MPRQLAFTAGLVFELQQNIGLCGNQGWNMRRVNTQKRHKRTFFVAAFAASAAFAPLIAFAQAPPSVSPPAPTEAPKTPEYEANVKALAGVMGSLHSLGSTCDASGDQTWRLNMQSLLDREGRPGAPLRVGMINAFNDGFQDQQRRHPTCNAGARADQRSIGVRGGQISRQLAQQNY
jgi:uncharacterized protein (TIGR02301 family)